MGYGVDEQNIDLAASSNIPELLRLKPWQPAASRFAMNKGGQAEIVEHGISGFLWQEIGELQDYTVMIEDDDLRRNMSEAVE